MSEDPVKSSGQISDFPQSSDFCGDQRIQLWEVEKWFAQRVSLTEHLISHFSEKP